MTSREVVRRAVRFEKPERIPFDLSPEYGSDLAWMAMDPHVDARMSHGEDEWGAVWDCVGEHSLGEVTTPPLREWRDFDTLRIPDIRDPRRWQAVESLRETAGDKFLLATGVSIYERVHFLRGLENTWMDLYQDRESLERLLDLLVEMNLYAITRYAAADADAFGFSDDWGLQKALMVPPALWREVWKPRYARIYEACHDVGLTTWLHSCGYIVDIIDDFIDAGLDMINVQQQENMGLELLGQRFGGRITFWCPVDIQTVMAHGSLDEIRAYCRKMAECLGRPEGGLIFQWYSDPVAAGHSPEAVKAMSQEFLRLSRAAQG